VIAKPLLTIHESYRSLRIWGPEVLTLADVEKPTPADNQVLVKVRAASVNPLDLTIRGLWLLRPLSGLRKPKDTRVGVDYAGQLKQLARM